MDTQAELLTINQVTDTYNFSRSYLYELFKSGEITRIQMGKKVLVRKTVIDEWLAKLEKRTIEIDDALIREREVVTKRLLST
ncbi:MAG: helix-turn-helix domain-containing protein [Rickettsiales bacterium]|nr:helix-turn-helix domain-containing protein [Rickettsiales bacterium]